jgi:hypothetical protein
LTSGACGGTGMPLFATRSMIAGSAVPVGIGADSSHAVKGDRQSWPMPEQFSRGRVSRRVEAVAAVASSSDPRQPSGTVGTVSSPADRPGGPSQALPLKEVRVEMTEPDLLPLGEEFEYASEPVTPEGYHLWSRWERAKHWLWLHFTPSGRAERRRNAEFLDEFHAFADGWEQGITRLGWQPPAQPRRWPRRLRLWRPQHYRVRSEADELLLAEFSAHMDGPKAVDEFQRSIGWQPATRACCGTVENQYHRKDCSGVRPAEGRNWWRRRPTPV